jgi:hypothetical protein
MKIKVNVSYNVNYSQEVELELNEGFEYIDYSELEFNDILDNNLDVLQKLEIPEGINCCYNPGSFEITNINK